MRINEFLLFCFVKKKYIGNYKKILFVFLIFNLNEIKKIFRKRKGLHIPMIESSSISPMQVPPIQSWSTASPQSKHSLSRCLLP